MKYILTILLTVVIPVSACAYKYVYSFDNTPISEALLQISKDHPEINISFIYKELDNYKTISKVNSDDTYDALRQVVGLNPVSIIKKDGSYYIEALQHGKFRYTGKVEGKDHEPVVAATVMLLSPNDSTVLTYGITDDSGRFSIPCDRQGIIAKLTSLGYKPTYKNSESFAMGTIVMPELPIKLKTINVNADNASLYSDKSVYRPTQRQKNASQTATDLLARMAIPQLYTRLGSANVTTAGGEPVAMYIDYVPATKDDLKMMRMLDVKSVEYLEFPTDPRFNGNKNVINFRMVKYEYGGYVKALGTENFIVNSGLLQANVRLVKNKMTCDIMGYGSYDHNNHSGFDQTETFHLPQEDGGVVSFNRESLTQSSKYRQQNYETSFRALYSDDTFTANNRIAFGIENTPDNYNDGLVRYSDGMAESSTFHSMIDSKAKYINYTGNYFYNLRRNNALSATIDYQYSHTDQKTSYIESNFSPIDNSANDDTNSGDMRVNYQQSFSSNHSIMTFTRWMYEHNRTRYEGSVEALDNSSTLFGQLGASYSYRNRKVSGSIGFGWNWLVTKLNENKSHSSFPYVDATFMYVLNKKNSFDFVFHHAVWPPSSNYKSENVVQVSPYLWYTGNPKLASYRSYDIYLYYTFVPSNKFNMTVFGGTWFYGNRYAFVYEATPEGIVRTIQQPIGSYGHYISGINAKTTQLDGKLQLSGRVEYNLVHNGKPHNMDRSYVLYYIQALYYLGAFNFAVVYQSKTESDNYDFSSGIWSKNKSNFTIQAGWSNSSWNIALSVKNIQRWNWKSSYSTMHSDHYSVDKWVIDGLSHAMVKLSATYTFGFGKKVKQGNDISKQSGSSSGILK